MTCKIPTEEGFYWAKWRICDDGTADEDEFHPSNTWAVVEVFENHMNDGEPDQFRVLVGGVEQSQSAENFFWGDGPLTHPGSAA